MYTIAYKITIKIAKTYHLPANNNEKVKRLRASLVRALVNVADNVNIISSNLALIFISIDFLKYF